MEKWREFRLRRLIGLGAAALLVAASPTLKAQLPQAPATYDLECFDVDAVQAAATNGTPHALRFFDRDHVVLLEPSDLRSSRFRLITSNIHEEFLSASTAPQTYKGTVVGDPDSVVRLSRGPHGLRGCMKTAEGWTFIEPADPAERSRAFAIDRADAEYLLQ